MKNEITILIADDHPIFRQGLRQIIETDTSLKVVAEAGDGETALKLIAEVKPLVAILDVNMPYRDGFGVLRAVREQQLATEVVFLTMHNDKKYFNAALDAGVKGYMLKDCAATEIINCLRAVASGQSYISPQLSSHLINRTRRADHLTKRRPAVDSLTVTERRVLKLLAEYKTSQEIADQLCISVRTVHHHRANIAEKLELKGSHALLKFATEHQSEL